jgi:hypothetical protein
VHDGKSIEKTEWAINNGQSRDRAHIWHKTQNEEKHIKNTTLKAKNDEQHGSHNKTESDSGILVW